MGVKGSLITISMARVIRSPRARVWHALVTPGEMIRWDTRRVRLDEPAPDHPAPGSAACWRFSLGGVTLLQREEVHEAIPDERLKIAVWLGSFRFDERYALAEEGPEATRLSITISAKNSMPMLGGELDRFDVRRLATERANGTLELLLRWCEQGEPAQMCSASETQRSGAPKRSRSSGPRSMAP